MNLATKMIVMDLDDTLLNDELEIGNYTKKVIRNAQKNGIKIIIASGRPTSAIIKYADELMLHKYNGYVISYNGAVITDCSTDKVIFEKKLSIENLHTICDVAQQENVFIHTYLNEKIITPKMNKYTDFEGELTNMPIHKIGSIKNDIENEVIKTLIVGDPKKLKEIEIKIQPQLGKKMNISISKPFFLEFTHKDVDKSKTIDVLMHKLNIRKHQVMAIGDSYNDLTMIKNCGTGVVMDNAPMDVKEFADHITHNNNADGVATAINRYVLGV